MKKEIKQVINQAHTEIKKLQIENFENVQDQNLHWAGLKGKIELLLEIAKNVLEKDDELLNEIETTNNSIIGVK